jgi:hypothetical protein
MARSRDPERWRRQLSGLARNNPALAEKIGRGELPGFAGPIEGTEHLHPDVPVPPRAPDPQGVPPSAPPAATVPVRREPTPIAVGHYQQEPDASRHDHPDVAEPPAGPDAPAGDAAARQRGLFGQLADGFLGRVGE